MSEPETVVVYRVEKTTAKEQEDTFVQTEAEARRLFDKYKARNVQCRLYRTVVEKENYTTVESRCIAAYNREK
jgi:hypothetical protein